MAHKGISSSKQTQKIVGNDPSNIFEYSLMPKITKPRRLVNFNDIITHTPIKKTLKEFGKGKNKKSKKSTITRFVDFDILIGPVIEQKEEIVKKPAVYRTFKDRVLSSLTEDSTIKELLKSYVNEKSKRSKSIYFENLKDKLNKESFTIEDINLSQEVEALERQTKEIEEFNNRWKEAKEDVMKINSFYLTNFESLEKKLEACKNYTEEDFLKNIENEKIKIDEKIKEKLNKLEFLRDSVDLNIQNLKEKIEEDEKKLFNLTEKDPSMDTMILLQAITKTK